jgi:hypothetical protein
MSNSKWSIVLAVALSAVACIAITNRPSEAQQDGAVPGVGRGRYQLQTSGASPSSTAFVIDTHTGRVWYRETNPDIKSWTDLQTPIR